MAGCDGRTAWQREPLPEFGEATAPAPLLPAAPRVRLTTALGDIVVELYVDRAPESTANFLRYVEGGFYDGTLFHRVVRTPMVIVQGGGFTSGLEARRTRPPVASEAANGLSNLRGTIALARTQDIDSATSQFYFNVTDNTMLDHRGADSHGYAVFGFVVEGMNVVDRLSMTPTHVISGTPHQNAPVDELVITSARRER
jgi:cyclophilin family peptidyl-prolyl cis-trans isomerase